MQGLAVATTTSIHPYRTQGLMMNKAFPRPRRSREACFAREAA